MVGFTPLPAEEDQMMYEAEVEMQPIRMCTDVPFCISGFVVVSAMRRSPIAERLQKMSPAIG